MSGDQLASRQECSPSAVVLAARSQAAAAAAGRGSCSVSRLYADKLPVPHSFGDPNAQPPTPRETPKSDIFPSPVFETPKPAAEPFDGASGWTPRFAEEYSVFNATPGNLRGSQGPFVDFAPFTPYQPSAGDKRPLSAEGIAAEIAAHVNHFSPNPNLPLPPVDPARRLQSSPGPLALTPSQLAEPDAPERSSKKPRRGTAANDLQASNNRRRRPRRRRRRGRAAARLRPS